MTTDGNLSHLWNSTNNTNGTDNGTGSGPRGQSQQMKKDYVAVTFFCILAVLIIFGNWLVIGAFRVNRRLRTTTNLLLMSLAVADMLIGLVSVPVWVYIITNNFNIGELLYKIYLTFDVICGVSSILNLTAISLERCYALLQPIRHRNIGKGVVLTAICVAWLLSIFASVLDKLPIPNIENIRGMVVTIVFFLFPLIIILGAYGTIFHIARAHARGRGVRSFKKDLRIATTVAVVIGLFIVCWTPFFALNFRFSLCRTTKFQFPGCLSPIPPFILSLNKWLQYGNSVCNPIVYGLRNKEFLIAFKKILLGICGKNVRLNDYSKSAYGRTVRSAYGRHNSSLENSRSVIYPPQVPGGMFDMRESYRKAIQNGRSKPIKLEFTKKTLADGLMAFNVDAFHCLPSGDGNLSSMFSSTSVSHVELSSSPGELCNPSFEGDSADTGICPYEQVLLNKDPEVENVSRSNNALLQKHSGDGSIQNGATHVHFVEPNDQNSFGSSQKGKELPVFERKRSLSEVFRRPRGDQDALKQELRSSFS